MFEELIRGWDGECVATRFDGASETWMFIGVHSTVLGPGFGGTRMKVYAEPGDEYKFLFIAKGGGSANKAFLFQATPSILTHDRMTAFLKEKVLTLGTAACPPYHLAIVIGGTSAEFALKTAKYASAKYLDQLKDLAGTLSGTYGSLALAANGAWTYTASSAHNEFVAGTTYSDVFDVVSADGTHTSVTIHILGTNDAAVLSAATANLTETNLAADISTSGTLTISDVDSPATFVAQPGTTGTYGTFAIDERQYAGEVPVVGQVRLRLAHVAPTDLVLFATGRKPNSANLGLEALGVKLAADGAIIVDRYSKSDVDSIHAVGDVTNRINLTPVATAVATSRTAVP